MKPNATRGTSGYGQHSSREGGHSSPSSSFSNRKNTPSGVSNVASRSDNSMGVSSKFVDRRGGKEIAPKCDDGKGKCK